jgi:hypothetical protein
MNSLRWANANREKKRERDRIWCRNNPDQVKARNDRRIFVGETYFGTSGFTESEIKELVNG